MTKWLQATHRYTTDLKRDASIPDPLEDFLFHQSAGHCEYFASAAAMLLRMGGVPTRYVNGFLGGEWNGLRQSITVRDNRAHSWVEAYLGSAGWVRVDATPAASRAAHMTRFRQVLDAVEMFWNRWVIEYSASQQLLLARQLSREFGWLQPHFSPRGTHHHVSRTQVVAVAAGLVALVVVLALAQAAAASSREQRAAPRTAGRAARFPRLSEDAGPASSARLRPPSGRDATRIPRARTQAGRGRG